MNIIAIIEARMGSSRLPGKTLSDIFGKTLLERVIDRVRLSERVSKLVVATSVDRSDDAIEEACRLMGVACYRGSQDDVLGRVYEAAVQYNGDIILQCGADNPFYDPKIIDNLIDTLMIGGYAYAANDMVLSFPEGIDAHVIRFDALKASAEEALLPSEREDTPRFIWNHPDRFPIYNLIAAPESKYNRPEIRLTVDYKEDIELARSIYSSLPHGAAFSTDELIALLDKNPAWLAINEHCEQLSAYYKP